MVKSAGKSLFSGGEKEVKNLIKNSEAVAPTLQKGGNYQRVVTSKTAVGVDRATGKATNTYTVITNKKHELVTAFPGKP